MKKVLKLNRWTSLGSIILLSACSVPDLAIERSDSAPEPDVEQAQDVPMPPLRNAGFEYKWEAWDETGPKGEGTAISNSGATGEHSAKISSSVGRFEQTVSVVPGASYQLNAAVQGSGKIGVVVDGKTLTTEAESDGDTWTAVSLPFSAAEDSEIVVFATFGGKQGRFDDFKIIPEQQS